ncbi:MAG TPA: Flp pilus assembly protein CpaB [Nitrospirota bacterium]|nr:Flp pilus assembly protein CpaB [Nitrospirota bacterium]
MATPRTTAAVIALTALVLASFAAYMVYGYLTKKGQEAAEAKLGVQPVVVAAAEIPFGTNIQPQQVKMADWPKNNLPAGNFTDTRAVQGRLAVTTVQAGSPVTEGSLAPSSNETGVLSYLIPPGKRAITVAVNEVVGVAGFVLPNSIVDVVATVTTPGGNGLRISKIILQNVKVLAVGQILEQKEGKPVVVPTVTLDVAPDEAEKLALASENKVQLILRHVGDTQEVKTKGATVAALIGSAAPAPAASGRPRVKKAAATMKPREDASLIIEVIKGNSRSKEKY